jgi:hypothetical protein
MGGEPEGRTLWLVWDGRPREPAPSEVEGSKAAQLGLASRGSTIRDE